MVGRVTAVQNIGWSISPTKPLAMKEDVGGGEAASIAMVIHISREVKYPAGYSLRNLEDQYRRVWIAPILAKRDGVSIQHILLRKLVSRIKAVHYVD